jgi:serine/threonine-protein kinase
LAGRLNHPNIVTIFDAGEDWDLSFIAMEVLKGVELRRYCQTGKLLPLAQVVTIIRTVTRALDYAHRHGVIHRDVKPANIMVVGRGQIKLTDFGIALIKGEMARLAGTPAYMAPEQLIEGAVVDGRTDLYALGVIFFELLSARKPFPATSFDELRQSIMRTPAPRIGTLVPGLPPAVDAVINRLLAKRPADRFANGRELEAVLAKLALKVGNTDLTPTPVGGDAGEVGEEGEGTVVLGQPAAAEAQVAPGAPEGAGDEATLILDPSGG